MNHVYTDLAVESSEIYKKRSGEVEGVSVEIREDRNYSITDVKILDERGSRKVQKPVGNYITIDVPDLDNTDEDLKDEVIEVLAKRLKDLLKDYKKDKVLIIGLGNKNITSDALGPKVVDRVYVTGHYFINFKKQRDETMSNVSAMSPGVLGITGIETSDIVKAVVEKTRPDICVVIDALASRNMNRVSTTIQISDVGITPGSGVGNKRMGLTKETLGVPVIAIGVPTVVNAATMINDTMDLIIDSMKQNAEIGGEFYSILDKLSKDEKYSLIQEMLSPFGGDVVVTPKDINVVIDDIAIIIANGLNISLHPGIDLQDVNRYIR